MRGDETIDERVFRILSKSEMTPNFTNPIVIPVIPFDGIGADRVVNYLWPSESSRLDFPLDEESRCDCDRGSRDNEEFMDDREADLSLDEMMVLDQRRIGYDPENIVRLSRKEQMYNGFKAYNDKVDMPPSRDLITGDPPSSSQQHSSLPKMTLENIGSVPKRSHSPLHTSIRGLQNTVLLEKVEIESRLEIMKKHSFESDVTSVFSTTSTVVTTPNILRLKAQKRRLERFLSEKSLESLQLEKPLDMTYNIAIPAQGY